jgi:hypothetical protein
MHSHTRKHTIECTHILCTTQVATAAAAVLASLPPGSGDLEWDAYSMLDTAVAVPDFLNFRPSVTAAAVLYAARETQTVVPPWDWAADFCMHAYALA